MRPVPIPLMRMSPRARSYLGILAFRHLSVGVIAVAFPHILGRVGVGSTGWFLPFLDPAHALDVWGIGFILIALVAASSAITRDVSSARFALGASVLSTWSFTVVILASLATGAAAGWLIAALLASISAKDLTMLRNPVRVPTEDVCGVDDPHERTRSAH